MSSDAVTLRRGEPAALSLRVAHRARAGLDGPDGSEPDLEPDLAGAVDAAHEIAAWLPLPMQGDTLTLWEALATLGCVDLTLARVAEPHLDAQAILSQASGDLGDEEAWDRHRQAWTSTRLWQVYAAEGSERLQARRGPTGWVLDGVKPWCSLADRADRALVTAWVDDERRGLFAVDLDADGVVVADARGVAGQAGSWPSRGLRQVRSTGLRFSAVEAVAVGPPQWYLTRSGFAWGGAGVAAIWYGAAVALARRLRDSAQGRQPGHGRAPDQVALLQLGAVGTALARARSVLLDASMVADDQATSLDESVQVAGVVRQVVADAAEEVLTRVGHALGPAPLTGDLEHARRVADLTVYLRQHHAERDLAAQGSRIVAGYPGWRWW